MAYVKPVLQPRSKSKYSFEVLIIGDSLSMNLLISSRGGMNYESGVFLCLDIHKSRNRYTAWENIRGQKEFNFSIELYNFGLLFKHPVNQRPEHITLISWWFKPWKIKLL
ncbi:hypothetical protein KUV50_03975 [Membranicola marinus]|uniref:Uncharacterized protein n=1 Tax=Membranihabitans marinus TaxID=1227546 RepID=A0A953LA55_9BACT|nr:hypothetical protein [Membranihabitans marinus]MBY5957281.1 hypothetical protein [Membranihabitans marinus]